MFESSSSSHGFLESIRQLGDGLLASVKDRFELFSIELQEEKLRLIRILILAIAAIFLGFLGIIFLSLTVVYLFWESARLAVLCSLTGLYVAAFVGVVVAFKRYLAGLPAPFEASRHELGSDRSCIRPRN